MNVTRVVYTAKENDTLRLGLMSLSAREKEVFIPHSDLHCLIQIQGGNKTNYAYVHTAIIALSSSTLNPLTLAGQYGPVYRATLKRKFNVEVVAKSIRKSLTKRVELNSYMHELNILKKNSHQNVAHLYGIVHES